jgi:hypothetical protein
MDIYLGDTLTKGRKDNPKGFFENSEIVELNEKMLVESGCRWENIFLPDISGESFFRYHTEARKIITRLSKHHDNIGFKDPRVTRYSEFWGKVLTESGIQPYYILVNRHPNSVSKSLRNRDYYPNDYSILLWLTYQKDALLTLLDSGGIVVDYDDLIDSPCSIISKISSYLGIELDEGKALDFANNFVDTSLRHARDARNENDTDPFLNEVSTNLYLLLKQRSQSSTVEMSEEEKNGARDLIFAIDSYYSRNRTLLEMIDGMGFGLRKRLFEIIDKERREIARYRSMIDWVEKRKLVRLANALKKPFKIF